MCAGTTSRGLDADELSRKFPEKFLWHVFDSIGRALYALYAHEEFSYSKSEEQLRAFGRGKTVHRDIKPQNIFMRWRPSNDSPGYSDIYPELVLGDFDIALPVELLQNRNVAGTLGYIPPVSIAQRSSASERRNGLLTFLPGGS